MIHRFLLLPEWLSNLNFPSIRICALGNCLFPGQLDYVDRHFSLPSTSVARHQRCSVCVPKLIWSSSSIISRCPTVEQCFCGSIWWVLCICIHDHRKIRCIFEFALFQIWIGIRLSSVSHSASLIVNFRRPIFYYVYLPSQKKSVTESANSNLDSRNRHITTPKAYSRRLELHHPRIEHFHDLPWSTGSFRPLFIRKLGWNCLVFGINWSSHRRLVAQRTKNQID